MDNGLIWMRILVSENPELQGYLDIFNYFFSLTFSFGMVAMFIGWLFRVISRS